MFSNHRQAPLERLSVICRERTHPFSECVVRNESAIRECLWRYSCGVVVSGGQTGVDTAAFDVAHSLGIPYTGFAPRSFINETGEICGQFKVCMREVDELFGTMTAEEIACELRSVPAARTGMYAERTCLNAQHSDATIILSPGELVGGNLTTYQAAIQCKGESSVFVIDIARSIEPQAEDARRWLHTQKPVFLNIAGSRESVSEVAGISPYEQTIRVCRTLFR